MQTSVLTGGSRLGPYEIESRLGSGGMGEVYRARDTRLDRTVAIKVVRDLGAAAPDLRQRFAHEARAVSVLNHPNIAALYDLGQHDGIDYLVLELVEGETLAARLARGAMPLDQALRHAREVIQALDHAHRRGVIHRDLKPSNVMLARSGVKVLDFGLAKFHPTLAVGDSGIRSAATQPMQQGPITEHGTLLGTLHYMAPELLEGKDVDARADLFAFGALLYEMVTGRRPFDGESPASVIAAILGSEPSPISAMDVPPALERLVQGCLEKDRADRWQDARDVRRALEDVSVGLVTSPASTPLAAPLRRWRIAAGAATLVAAALAAVAFWFATRPAAPADREVVRLSVPLPASDPYSFREPALAISPDGRNLVYALTLGRQGASWLYQRPLNQVNATRIEGTGGGQGPFFSPDGQWVGFVANRRLKKVRLSGGVAETVCELPSFSGAAWGADGTIVFPDGAASGLFRVSAAGGAAQPLTTLQNGERSHRNPQFLPDGRAVVFTVTTTETISYDEARIEVVALDTGTRRVLLKGARIAWPVSPGQLLYARAANLFAVPFDLEQRRVTGDPTLVVPDVWMAGSFVQAAISPAGVLAHLPAQALMDNVRRLVWIDRRGNVQAVREERRPYLWPRISPDGKQVATVVQGPNNALWTYHIERTTFTPMTSQGDIGAPVWMPDGRRLLYSSAGAQGGEEIYSAAVDGSGAVQRLLSSSNSLGVAAVAPDGGAAVINEVSPTTRNDILVLPLSSGAKPWPFLQTPAEEWGGRISPDGRWLAYSVNEVGPGRDEVYVRAFPGPGERHPISTNGGLGAAWSASGRELFYRERNRMMVVDVKTAPSFTASIPRPLFDLKGRFREEFDVTPDGQRFILVHELEDEPPTEIRVGFGLLLPRRGSPQP